MFPGAVQQQVSEVEALPASVGGINARDSMLKMQPDQAVFLYNMTAIEYGLLVRQGNVEWTHFTDNSEVRTIIAFNGPDSNDVEDKLYVATEDGIYDVTSSGQTDPVLDLTFAIQAGFAGYMSYVQYTNVGSDFFIVAADEENGLFQYTQTTDTWAVKSDITGPTNPLVFVTQHKGRLWFVEKDTGNSWYLPVGAISGAATLFQWGNKFKYGGNLVGLWKWTIDGGDGSDDYLIGVSRAGDVVVYQGTDPANSSTWDKVGQWYIGDMPAGRRQASEFGGDLFLLSAYGITSLQGLLRGGIAWDTSSNVSSMITRLIRNEMSSNRNLPGWEIKMLPAEGVMLVNIPPTGDNIAPIQFVYSLSTNAWSIWRGWPSITFETWQARTYFGQAGSLYSVEGFVVDVTIDGLGGLTGVEFSSLTSFQTYGSPGRQKRAQFIRPIFIGVVEPAFNVEARYTYDFTEISLPPPTVPGLTAPGIWDTSSWDFAVWAGGLDSFEANRGSWGFGTHMAVIMRGEARAQVTFIEYEMLWDTGGFL